MQDTELFLRRNDFSESYIQEAEQRLAQENVETAADKNDIIRMCLLPFLENINTIGSQQTPAKYRYFIGSSGSGKTNSLDGLAMQPLSGSKNKICLVGADRYKISADQQLEKFAKFLKCDTFFPNSDSGCDIAAELKHFYEANNDKYDAFFIDTSAVNPYNAECVAKLKTVLSVRMSNAVKYLCIPATMKYIDIVNNISTYRYIGFDSVIVTKCDETATFGNVISALHDCRANVSYLTDGRAGCKNIHPATADWFIRMLHQCNVNED